ncbi:hypothetical protein F2Q68_00016238 [Brassica cretica]|uniref:Uncharacterized protein n=1 Tax=Brassica cretica TaxID=69181 RepID=A0A8S9HLZ2_BRACR|nr:hypothetical protein F2Q68_00016238 [Brassica cretica]
MMIMVVSFSKVFVFLSSLKLNQSARLTLRLEHRPLVVRCEASSNGREEAGYEAVLVPLRWRDGPAANGELARTLLLLEQRHLDTQAQMALRTSTTTRWKSPSGRIDMSGIGGNGGSVASG